MNKKKLSEIRNEYDSIKNTRGIMTSVCQYIPTLLDYIDELLTQAKFKRKRIKELEARLNNAVEPDKLTVLYYIAPKPKHFTKAQYHPYIEVLKITGVMFGDGELTFSAIKNLEAFDIKKTFKSSDVGKTIFFTLEEAVKARENIKSTMGGKQFVKGYQKTPNPLIGMAGAIKLR